MVLLAQNFNDLTEASILRRFEKAATALPAIAVGPRSLEKRDSPNIYDVSWVKTQVAVGDSYAAGLGAGNPLSGPGDADCKRFDAANPVLLNNALATTTFTNIPCSGATSQDIIDKQISTLTKGSADLITVSAGGNDVGFTAVLSACVYLTTTQSACDDAIKAAEGQIQAMSVNIDKMLSDLAPILSKDGMILYSAYAQFWNDAPNYCDDISWAYWDPLGIAGGLKLTSNNRKAMNKLVSDVNAAIFRVVASARSSTRQPIPVYAASWDAAVIAVGGRFCEDADSKDPGATDDVEMFIRLNGSPYPKPGSKKRSSIEARAGSTAPGHQVNKRVPVALIKPFHPTYAGHQLISATNLGLLVYGRAKTLNVDPTKTGGNCAKNPPPGSGSGTPNCNTMSSGTWKATDKWVSQEAAAAAVAQFCKGGKSASGIPSGDLQAGKYYQQQGFYGGTANDLQLVVTYYENANIDEKTCSDRFLTIVNGCDVPSGNTNPQNLKYGGTLDYQSGKSGGVIFAFNPNSNKVGGVQTFCNDDDTNTFMDPDILSQNAKDFCSYITTPSDSLTASGVNQPSQTYNKGTINEVGLSANWPAAGFPPTLSDCQSALGPLNGGCNIPGGGKNPSNFKHGGHIVLDTERLFSVAPKSNNTVTDGTNFGHISQPKTIKGDKGQNGKAIDKPTLQKCLRGLQGGDWTGDNGADCAGMVTFYIGHRSGWNSVSDCYNACSNGVSQMIDQGNAATNCDAFSGFTACWMGYYIKT